MSMSLRQTGRRRVWRRRRMAFWHLTPSRLTVAVMERAAGEPLLVACATVLTEAQTPLLPFAPGVLEAARVVGATGLRHAVALDAPHCRVMQRQACSDDATPLASVAVLGDSSLEAVADPEAVLALRGLFAMARLRLVAVDCAPCALLNLERYLGASGTNAAAPDPLTAISVSPECEAVATTITRELAVPVGLALGHCGLVADAER